MSADPQPQPQPGRSAGAAVVVGGDRALTDIVVRGAAAAGLSPLVHRGPAKALADVASCGLAVYLPAARNDGGEVPDAEDAARVFEILAGWPGCHVVLVSSAAVYEPSHHHPGHLSEKRLRPRRNANPIAGRWLELERHAARRLGAARLTVLRPTLVPLPGGRDHASRLFGGRLAVTLPGYDPSLQILAADDLAQAVRLAAERRLAGVYNVAPDGAVPLHRALRRAGRRRLPLPRWLQRPARSLLGRRRGVASLDQTEYIRYPWTVSAARIRRELGFATVDSGAAPEPDPFGMDREYIDFYGRVLFRFVHDYYWRVELDGLEHVPRTGRGVLVGVHRGFMPFDGVMTLHALARHRQRYPRFLIHPTLTKFPFLGNFMTKLGGVLACRENADWVLGQDGLLGVYPEGIDGAFSYYRDAYRLRRFGRGDFVQAALRNRAPILPFVTVGSAEIFPILAKLRWPWWQRVSEWPCLPITPTFPLVPLPLPSKWHTRFLEPLPVHETHPPEAAEDSAVVAAIGREVEARIGQAIEDMRRRRQGIFWGSIFGEQQG